MRPLPLLATVTALSLAACAPDPSSEGEDGAPGDSPASPTTPRDGTGAGSVPVPWFEWSCAMLTCSFTDGTYTQHGTITSWSWNFGDSSIIGGGVSSEENPTYVFPFEGGRPVTLTVTNSDGLSNTVTRGVEVTWPHIILNAATSRVKNQRVVDLFWSGADSSFVDVYREDAGFILNTLNDGDESTTVPTNGTYQFKVCQGIYCSSLVTVTF